MRFASVLASRINKLLPRKDTPPRRKTGSFRPQLRALEARDVPSAGSLDPTFGTDGVTTAEVAHGPYVDVAVQPDDKLVAASAFFSLARYNADGSLDASFGSGGITSPLQFREGVLGLEPGYYPRSCAVAIQADGRIVVAGTEWSPEPGFPYTSTRIYAHFLALRYNADGSPDDGSTNDSTPGDMFGVGGAATIDFGPYSDARCTAMALATDGSIVLAGDLWPGYGLVTASVARLTPDGIPDPTFGVAGRVAVANEGSLYGNTFAQSVAVQPDGKVVFGNPRGVNRLTPAGTLDPTFGTGGFVPTGFAVEDLALQDDGKIVGVGQDTSYYSGTSTLARLNGDGSLDASFGGGARVAVEGKQLAIYPTVGTANDGRIVVLGSTVSRFNSDGSTDNTFGISGSVDNAVSTWWTPGDVALQADGRIVVCGASEEWQNSALARYQGSDDSLPSLVISDAYQIEGDQGRTTFAFTVSLTRPSDKTVTVQYTTADGSATTADGDYQGTTGTLTFKPGQTALTIKVTVFGDTRDEGDEYFDVRLSSPTNATLLKWRGAGGIGNDDRLASSMASGTAPAGTTSTSQSAATSSGEPGLLFLAPETDDDPFAPISV